MAPLSESIRRAAILLPSLLDPTFAQTFDRFANARIVLIGEASHGTAEFYHARAEITKRLIEKHGFETVAVEADWPDARFIDRYVRLEPQVPLPEPPFSRFPTWMWQNTQVHDFMTWLQVHNQALRPEKRVGFYGLDLYSLYSSIAEVTHYLNRVDPKAAQMARRRYGCLSPWIKDPAKYGLLSLSRGSAPCEDSVVRVLVDLLEKRLQYIKKDGEDFFDAEQNAHLIADAEHYYRLMYYGGGESWNLRDTHMFETLERILEYKGEGSKVVVWAHNSHIGDARYTGMGRDRNELNLGQLCRERLGESEVCLIGQGTHTGTVTAASDWEQPVEVMQVNPSLRNSYEWLAHDTGLPCFMLDLRKGYMDEHVKESLMKPRLERFIGVVYRPETELWSHYSEAVLPKQFDSYIWFDQTAAVKPLHTKEIHHAKATDETYPFGL